MIRSNYKYPFSTFPIRALDAMGVEFPLQSKINFVIEKGDWSIKWDGHYITSELNKIIPNIAKTTSNPFLLNRNVVHFGSQYQCVSWYKHMAKSNKMVCTFFHGKKTDDDNMARHVDDFIMAVPNLHMVITAASVIEQRLLSWGVPSEKLVKIPIGIDTKLFKPFSNAEKFLARQKYGIRPDQLVIGSFQKDGQGWGEGAEPKMIKGPDILVSVLKELSKHRSIFVLLTGPARGYVKKQLDALGIEYAHENLSNYLDLPSRFAPLDLYVNPSREEGGPKGILEAMASGVYVVSSKVGMAPDIIKHGINGALVDVEDVNSMVSSILNFRRDDDITLKMIENARCDILPLDWKNIACQHYDLVYKGLLS